MAATPIGLYTKVASVWRRAVPSTKVTGVWETGVQMYARVAGVWEVVWASAAASLRAGSVLIAAVDLSSPFDIAASWRMLADGDIETAESPTPSPSFTNITPWLLYDVGRSYEVFFTVISGPFSTTPTLDTWLDATAGTYLIVKTSTTGGLRTSIMDVSFREVGGGTLRTARLTFTTEGLF